MKVSEAAKLWLEITNIFTLTIPEIFGRKVMISVDLKTFDKSDYR